MKKGITSLVELSTHAQFSLVTGTRPQQNLLKSTHKLGHYASSA